MKNINLKVISIDINKIKESKNNAKLHPREQIEQIKKSIKEFEMIDPIGIYGKDNIIVEGHGRLIACKELGYKEILCIRLDHLTDEQRKAYTLIHNKLTMNSDFDIDLLQEELDNIIDLDMNEFGFDTNFELTENLIDDLLENEYADSNYEKETFDVSFNFDNIHKQNILGYIKENGKNPIIELIIKECEKDA